MPQLILHSLYEGHTIVLFFYWRIHPSAVVRCFIVFIIESCDGKAHDGGKQQENKLTLHKQEKNETSSDTKTTATTKGKWHTCICGSNVFARVLISIRDNSVDFQSVQFVVLHLFVDYVS